MDELSPGQPIRSFERSDPRSCRPKTRTETVIERYTGIQCHKLNSLFLSLSLFVSDVLVIQGNSIQQVVLDTKYCLLVVQSINPSFGVGKIGSTLSICRPLPVPDRLFRHSSVHPLTSFTSRTLQSLH